MTEKVNVLLVDDQPDKLLAYEVILHELNENLVKTSSAREALQFLLKNDVAVILIDVCMPELDGFQLAAVLRAKVKVFVELYRKTRELEQLNLKLERHVAERTAELEASNMRLLQSEQGRRLALAAGQVGSWDFDPVSRECKWDEGQHHIFGVERERFQVTVDNIRAMVHPEDWVRLLAGGRRMAAGERTIQTDFRAVRPDGSVRWCTGTAA